MGTPDVTTDSFATIDFKTVAPFAKLSPSSFRVWGNPIVRQERTSVPIRKGGKKSNL